MNDIQRIIPSPDYDWLLARMVTNSHGFVFTGNPVILTNAQNWPDFADKGLYSVRVNGVEVYTGHYNFPLTVDISEILDGYIKPPKIEMFITDDEICTCPTDEAEIVLMYKRNPTIENYSESNPVLLKPLAGGISRRAMKQCAQKDIFDSRFLNRTGNFFMTSRTAENIIILKETELFPLAFICTDPDDVMNFVHEATGYEIQVSGFTVGICGVNLTAIRRRFAESYNLFPSVLAIEYNGKRACNIVIEPAVPSHERYILTFRNSLGCFEQIDFAGTGVIIPVASEDDDATYLSYDIEKGGFASNKLRSDTSLDLNVRLTPQRQITPLLLLDMLSSDEAYLSGNGLIFEKVILGTDNLEIAMCSEKPETFSIKFTLAEPVSRFTQELLHTEELKRQFPYLFSQKFSKMFN